MTLFKYDLEDRDDTLFEPVPEGRYLVKIVKAESKKKDGSEYPYINLELEILEDGPYLGRKLFMMTFLSPKARKSTFDLYVAAGAPFSPDGFDTDDLIGREIIVHAKIESYQGNLRNRVEDAFPV